MSRGPSGSWWIAFSVLVIPLAISIALTIPLVVLMTSFQSSLGLQQAVAFNAKELGERMGRFIGAGLALGLAGVGAGIAVGLAGAAAISAFTEKPEVFGRSFLIVVLGEGIAIYGIAIAILVLILGVP